jgi:hydrogenase expression/formation protein HypD
MMKVPGNKGSLEISRASGGDVRVVYSALDALEIAAENTSKEVVFFGIGFETTSPSIASCINLAREKNIKNFSVYSCHKLIPPAMKALLGFGRIKIDGFICPGHVSTVIGSQPYEFIPEKYEIPCVIAGFEPVDILSSIFMLVKQKINQVSKVEIQYTRSVKPQGNLRALSRLFEVFEVADSNWRGIGLIPDSGLRIKEEYREFDASYRFEAPAFNEDERTSGCICGSILRGESTPFDCSLFGKVCTPFNPVGACMVSSEGTCSAYYKYGGS